MVPSLKSSICCKTGSGARLAKTSPGTSKTGKRLALAKAAPDGAVKTVVDEATLVLEVAEFIDTSAEVERLSKTLDKLHKEIGGLSGRLGNEAFVAKAPPEVVAEQRIRLAELRGTRDKLSAAREQLSS